MSEESIQNKPECVNVNPQQLRQQIALNVAYIAGLFCLLVAITLFISHLRFKEYYPLDAKGIIELKQKLVQNPKDESLKVQIRKLDLELRTEHERHIRFVKTGKVLLIIGAVVFVSSIQVAFWRRKLCVIKNKNQMSSADKKFYQSAGAVILVVICLTSVGFIIIRNSQTNIPNNLQTLAKASSPPIEVLPSYKEYTQQWPRFRGPFGDGTTVYTNAPIKWDSESGLNLIWKTEVPSNGFNSPIVWNDKVFLSAGTAQKREVYCYNASDGKLLWQTAIENAPGSPPKPPDVPDYTGFAAATMATDGKRAFAIFATYDLAALSFDGKIVWAKYMGEPKNPHGHATSLLTYSNMLILQLDQGEVEDKLSKLYAFDVANGKVIWQTPRPVSSSWATPLVFDSGGTMQVITISVPYAISYSITNGAELWRYEGIGGEVVCSPVYSNGRLIIISPSDKIIAIDPQGRGDITKTKYVLWTSDENVPDVTSPIATKDYVFTITTMGILTCFNAADGKKIWDHDFGTDFHSSPLLIGDKIYLIGQKGNVYIVKAENKYEEIASFKMNDKFHASPAILNDRLYLRGEQFLYCIGNKVAMASK
ncbi:MAG TPA: PQQ-binding-like beta-propeller repeat protein [Verrucomicrobiota bacterium]|nr:PQQ-binding-like beta-propeller repeat protein [Verrucomicrobiota bacterium]